MNTSPENQPLPPADIPIVTRSSDVSKKPKMTKLGYASAETAKTDQVLVRDDGSLDTSVLSQNQMRFIAKYIKANGIVSYACKLAKISRDTFYRWMAENKTFEALIQRANEEPLDLVRLKLWEQIQKGNINAITLYLRAHDKSYSERVNISGKLELSPSWYEEMKPKVKQLPKVVLQQALDNKQLKELDTAMKNEDTKGANKLLTGGHDTTTNSKSGETVADAPESPALGAVSELQGTEEHS